MVRQMHSGASERLRNWLRDESGAVTTDWVLLVALIVTLSVVVMTSITGGVQVLADNTESSLASRQPGQL